MLVLPQELLSREIFDTRQPGRESRPASAEPVLEFYDGTPVKTAADWARRREEIRTKWHEMMGPWPPLIDKPGIEYIEKEKKKGYTQHTVKVQLAPSGTRGRATC